MYSKARAMRASTINLDHELLRRVTKTCFDHFMYETKKVAITN